MAEEVLGREGLGRGGLEQRRSWAEEVLAEEVLSRGGLEQRRS